MVFQEGQQIGNYTLIKKIGEGGFGQVWLAENRNNPSSEKVAIKLPLNDQIDLQVVKDEIFNWTGAGRHKNILPFIEWFPSGNRIALVSEYAPNGSLQDLINKKDSLPVSEAVEITIEILDGLVHLHSREIIHRDLKPDNVLFQGKIPRLTDFGISRAMQIDSHSQTVKGTYSYMSPEAFDGKRNAQTDIWSVGVILYQLLSGKLPFPQKTQVELVGALVMKEPVPLPDSVPPVLQYIVKKSLEKDSTKRFQTAEEMKEAIKLAFVAVRNRKESKIEIVENNVFQSETIYNSLQANEKPTEILPDYLKPTQPSPFESSYELPPTESSPIDSQFDRSSFFLTEKTENLEVKPQPLFDSRTEFNYQNQLDEEKVEAEKKRQFEIQEQEKLLQEKEEENEQRQLAEQQKRAELLESLKIINLKSEELGLDNLVKTDFAEKSIEELEKEIKSFEDRIFLFEKFNLIIPTKLNFCTRCGNKVEPYSPSQIPLNDYLEYGRPVPEETKNEPHYWCSVCEENWLAMNTMDTGGSCHRCYNFYPLYEPFCGNCGAKRNLSVEKESIKNSNLENEVPKENVVEVAQNLEEMNESQSEIIDDDHTRLANTNDWKEIGRSEEFPQDKTENRFVAKTNEKKVDGQIENVQKSISEKRKSKPSQISLNNGQLGDNSKKKKLDWLRFLGHGGVMFFFCGYLLGTRFLFELALPNKLPLILIIVLGLIFLIVLISFWMYLIPVGIKYKIERFILSIWDARIFNKLLNFALIIFYFAGVLFWTVLFFSIAYGFLILGQLVY